MLNFAKKGFGTYCRSYDWAKYLVRMGYEATIACLSNEQRTNRKIYYDDGIRIYETPNFIDLSILMSRFSGMQGWGAFDINARLWEILRGKYDIIHTFEHHPNVSFPIYLTSKKKLPILISDWCDNYGKGGFRDSYKYRLDCLYRNIGFPLRKLFDFIERDLKMRSKGITVISKFLLLRAIDIGIKRERIFLIRGSVDTDKIRPFQKEIAKKKLGFNKETKLLAFLGTHQSDLDLALKALNLILRYEPDINFLIIGKKSSIVREKAAKLGVIKNIIQTGWCSGEELPLYLSAADAFLLPMKNNPANLARWPNKIGEYAAAGRPTISTKVGDVAELIEKEKIGLVSEVNSQDFASKIMLILQNRNLSEKMGKKARDVAENKFAIDIQGLKIKSIYEALIRE